MPQIVQTNLGSTPTGTFRRQRQQVLPFQAHARSHTVAAFANDSLLVAFRFLRQKPVQLFPAPDFRQTSRSFGRHYLHRLVRVTAWDALDPSRDRRVDGITQQPRSVPVVMDLGFRSDPNLHRAAPRPIESADRSTASRGWCQQDFWKADRRNRPRVGDQNLEENVREERAHTPLAACLPSVPRQREVPAAARKFELPLSRFPLRGKGFPPRRWHAVRQQKAWHTSMPRLPRKRGFKALR
jgi:hypothetical protein